MRGVVDLSSIHYPKFKLVHLQRYFHRDNDITFERGTGCFEFCNNSYSSNKIGNWKLQGHVSAYMYWFMI